MSEIEEIPIWDIRETCTISLNKQGGKLWKKLRIGCIQASLISEICERTYHSEAFPKRKPEELAEILCGLSVQSFTPSQELAMADGTIGEPIVRDWFSNQIIKKPIKEVGVAIWKQDPYFRASLDGETTNENNEEIAIEIKVPKQLASKYIHVVQSWGKGLNNPHPDTYIYPNHYDQIMTGCNITNKKGAYYVVSCLNDGTSFYQYLDVDVKLWNTILYPKAKEFHNKYVLPLLEKNKIDVLFP